MRQIFIVDAMVVDSNGTFNHISGYPKQFDSSSYNNDVNKTRRRAEGDMFEAWGAMCKRDDRQLQSVILTTAEGFFIESKTTGWPVEEETPAES